MMTYKLLACAVVLALFSNQAAQGLQCRTCGNEVCAPEATGSLTSCPSNSDKCAVCSATAALKVCASQGSWLPCKRAPCLTMCARMVPPFCPCWAGWAAQKMSFQNGYAWRGCLSSCTQTSPYLFCCTSSGCNDGNFLKAGIVTTVIACTTALIIRL